MKQLIVFSFLALAAGVAPVHGQDGHAVKAGPLVATGPVAPPGPPIVPPPECCPAECVVDGVVCGPPGRFWARADYLLWWVKGSPLPPLLTTSPPGTPVEAAGVLGEPTTTVLFGGNSVAGDARSGGRFTLGYWLDEQQTWGIEGSFFMLEQRSEQFFAASPGVPILARPFFDVTLPGQNALLVAYPGVVAGTFQASFTSRLWGAEANLRKNLCCSCKCRVDLLGGYRFLGLDEDLGINEREISADPTSPAPVGTTFDLSDRFRTRNAFHGGQLGLAAESWLGRFIFQATAKVALGVTNREVEISGFTQQVGLPAEQGGFLASRTNTGRFNDSRFSVVPEANFNLGYQVTDCLRVFAGYSFLYWTNVARPGSQIDPAVNPTQLPPGVLEGEARPAFRFRNSDVWAQGINFGLECRF